MQKRLVATLLLVIIALSAVAIWSVQHQGPSPTSTFTRTETSYGIPISIQQANMSGRVMEKPCSIQIFTDGTTIWAQDCDNGNILYSGTSASTVINNAINSLTNGGLVFIKAGTYSTTSTITIPYQHNGITMMGEGFATRLLVGSGASGISIQGSRTTITSLRIDLTSQSGTHLYGVHGELGSSNITLTNSWITGGRPGVFFDGSTGVIADGNIIYDSNGDGLTASNSRNVLFQNNYIINAGLTIGNCLSFSSSANVTAIGNHLDQCYHHGIALENAIGLGTGKTILIANNFIRDVQGDGIYVYPANGGVPTASKVNIVGNTVVNAWGASSSGITVRSGSQVNIANNYVANVTHAGILIDSGAGTQFSITGNMVSNVGNAAIDTLCPSTTITGNTVMGLSQQGIYVGANSTTVSGNTVTYSPGGITNYGGIYVTPGTSDVVISGNTIRYAYFGINLAGNNYDITVTGNSISAPAYIGIAVSTAVYRTTVSGNVIQAATSPAMSNAGIAITGVLIAITGNIVDGPTSPWVASCIALSANTLNSTVIGNNLNHCSYGIREVSGDDYNLIATNYIGTSVTTKIAISGTHDQVFHNFGYNPQAAATITVTASPFTYTNTHGYVELVTVASNGATINEIDLRGTNTNLTAGSFLLYPGDSITVTYGGGTPLMERYPQ